MSAAVAEPAGARGASGQRVAALLREEIMDGTLPPGTRLRQEELAGRVGGSRIPVREALRLLEAEGLVETEPNRGARVVLRDAREVDLLYQMREQLEPLALAESVPRLGRADLAELDALQARIERWEGVAAFVRLDREFHLRTYARCGMEPLTSTVLNLWNATQYYRRLYVELSGAERRWIVNAEHRLLLEAVERGDVVDAGLCLRGHIRRTRVELGRHPELFATR